jgi:hypothetical protein
MWKGGCVEAGSSREPDVCAFCGQTGSDFAPEHWIPRWLSRELIPTHATSVTHLGLGAPGAPLGEEVDAFEFAVPHVCTKCNETWLSSIEGKAKRHVLPFILGTAGPTLTLPGLQQVARWCYLKVISLELGRPAELRALHSEDVYSEFKRTKRPPYPNCSLALGVREIGNDKNPIFVWWRSRHEPMVATPLPSWTLPKVRFEGYRTTLVIGQLVIDVIGAGVPTRLDVEHGEGFEVLWPLPVTGGKFRWPPDHRFTALAPDGLS